APGLDLCDKQEVTRGLLLAGADIEALNTVRKHCSQVKGGGLLRAAAGAAGVWTLVLSDVVGDDPATIGSGPTVPDPTTFADAARVVARFLAPEDVPAAVQRHLERGLAGRVPETVKPGEPAVLLAAGTDGVDGPTDAAGACVDGETAGRARARGLDPAAALARTDSHPLLDAAGDLVRTGPTGTNVADVVVTLRATC